MTDAVDELRQRLQNERLIWWAGSGVSVDSPTCAPTATTFLRAVCGAVYQRLNADYQASSPFVSHLRRHWRRWQSLLTMERSDVAGAKPISFERFLGVLEEEGIDPRQELLQLMFDALKPNRHHSFLARRLAEGDLVITTNFDGCIEAAYREQFPDRRLTVAVTLKEVGALLASMTAGRGGLVKLHGSLRDPRGSLRVETVQSTVQRLLRATPQGIGLPTTVAEGLQHVMQERSTIVVGYSGSDDLDIVPTWLILHDAKPWTWLLHPRAHQAERLRVRRQLFRSLIDSRSISPDSRVVGSTLGQIGGYRTPPSTPAPDLAGQVASWFQDQRLDSLALPLVLAGLLQEAGRPDAAGRMLDLLEPGTRRRPALVRCLFEKMRARTHADAGDRTGCRSAARALLAASLRAPAERSAAHQHLAVLAQEEGDLRAALRWVNRALRYSRRARGKDPVGFAHDLNLKAAILSEMGDAGQAFDLFLEAWRTYRRVEHQQGALMAASNLESFVEQSAFLRRKLRRTGLLSPAQIVGAREQCTRFFRPCEAYRVGTTGIAQRGVAELTTLPDEIASTHARFVSPDLIADRLVNLAQNRFRLGAYQLGTRLVQRALRIYRRRHTLGGEVRAHYLLAQAAFDTDRAARAQAHLSRAMKGLRGKYANASMLASAYHLRGQLAMQRADWATARRSVDAAERLKRTVLEDSEVLVCQYTRGMLYAHRGEHERALEVFRSLERRYRMVKDTNGIADVCLQLGLLHLRRAEWKRAAGRFEQAAQGYDDCRLPLGSWRARVDLVRSWTQLRRHSDALTLARQLVTHFPEGVARHERREAYRLLVRNAIVLGDTRLARRTFRRAKREGAPPELGPVARTIIVGA